MSDKEVFEYEKLIGDQPVQICHEIELFKSFMSHNSEEQATEDSVNKPKIIALRETAK